MKTDQHLIWEKYKTINESVVDFDDILFDEEFPEEILPKLNQIGASVGEIEANGVSFLEVSYEGEDYIFFKTDNVFKLISSKSELSDNLHDMDVSELVEYIWDDEEKVYLSGWETTIEGMGKNPPDLYHYTREDNLEKIYESGGIRGSRGTSLTNRMVTGIFTSLSPETYGDGSYGDVLITIHTGEYKKQMGVSKVTVAPEPTVFEADVKSAIFNMFTGEYADFFSESGGEDPLTVVLSEAIPVEFLSFEYGGYNYRGSEGLKELIENMS